ncbi:MAG: response regulator transcription factor [Acidobacteria bacterium]|nr:response regulator transcription factor [Acidobacteriota bacterium]
MVVGCELVRRGILDLLSGLEGVKEILSPESLAEVATLATVKPSGPVLLLVEAHLATPAGLARVREAGEATVLLLLRERRPAALLAAARLPADGYLLEEEISLRGLEAAIEAARRRELVLPAVMAHHVLSHTRRGRRPVSLTRRERDVLDLLAEGLTNRQAAHRLGVSENAVKHHVASLLMRLEVPNRTAAVAVGIEIGILGSASTPGLADPSGGGSTGRILSGREQEVGHHGLVRTKGPWMLGPISGSTH